MLSSHTLSPALSRHFPPFIPFYTLSHPLPLPLPSHPLTSPPSHPLGQPLSPFHLPPYQRGYDHLCQGLNFPPSHTLSHPPTSPPLSHPLTSHHIRGGMTICARGLTSLPLTPSHTLPPPPPSHTLSPPPLLSHHIRGGMTICARGLTSPGGALAGLGSWVRCRGVVPFGHLPAKGMT